MPEIIERRQAQAWHHFVLSDRPALLQQQLAADDVRLAFDLRILPPEMLDLLLLTHDQVSVRTLVRKAGERRQRRVGSRFHECRVADKSDAFELPL